MDIEHVFFAYGKTEIFNDISLHVNNHDHIGVVGVNGAGKSTLFHLILGDYQPDFGTITTSENTRIAYLPQVIKDEIPDMSITVEEYLKNTRPLKELEAELATLYQEASVANEKKSASILKKAGKVQAQIDYFEPYKMEEQLIDLAIGFHIFDLLDSPLNTLSGGQKSKVAFARILFSKAEIVLLDEPTNHLDLESKEYIMNYLQKYPGIILVISHDIPFLNKVTNKTLHLDKQKHNMELFLGSYETFQKRIAEEKKTNERIAAKQEKEEEKLKKIIAKYIRGNEKKAKIAKDRQKKLARLEQNKVVLERLSKKANFKMEIKEKGDFYPLRVDKITFGYTKDHLLYENISLQMIRGDRFVIVGENGVGKSTLLKLIMGTLQPLEGTVEIGEKISIGYYAQEHETLEEEKTIVEQFESITKDISFLRGVLGRFLFSGDDIYKKVSVLSPGERSRVALAKLALEKSNLLLLDEPTNHLDPDTQSLIAEVFKDYPGTLLVVSHNIEFVKNLNISKMLYLPSGKITDFDPEIIEAYEYLNEQ